MGAGPADADNGPGAAGVNSPGDALRASEARFRNVIEANADGVVVVLLSGVIAYANPAATALLGRPAAELVGSVFGVPVVAGETTEVDVPRAGGEPRVAELRVVQTEWEGQRALLASLRDVTERKRLEEDLRHHAAQLAEADRLKDQFLAMLAHELRNPLAPILNAAHVMRLRDDDPAVLARMRDVIEHQASHIARLVDDLLDVSRFTQGKIQLRKEIVNLATVVSDAVEAIAPLADARGHSLVVRCADEPLWLDADATRLRQIVANLLDNAVKYTDPGGTIRLSISRDGDEAVLRVQDNGIGIAPEMLPRVFDLFAQADCSLDRSRGGLGIGLTLVKTLVALHGGTVQVTSGGRGKGCEVTVRLGLSAVGADQAPRQASPASSPIPKRVLIVDDNRFSADSLASFLEFSGHAARIAYRGHDALELAATFRPDFVLLDIGLPEMDGFEVARRLRLRADLRDAVLVAVTGYGHDEIVSRSRQAGFDHHLVKPLDLDGLLALLSTDSARNAPRL